MRIARPGRPRWPAAAGRRSGRAGGVGAWLLSLPVGCGLLLTGRVHRRPDRVGTELVMSDGRAYTPFRCTVREPNGADATRPPAVLQVRFRLRGMGGRHRLRHLVFRWACIVTTPLFAGISGFRSKLWMVDPVTGDFAGLYEWDDAPAAQAYGEGLCSVLRRVSVPGTVSHELVPASTVDDYLGDAPD